MEITFEDLRLWSLSRGYSCRQLVPRKKSIENAVLNIDNSIRNLLRITQIDLSLCWGHLTVSDKTQEQ